ncbi:MAG: bifunctional SulP family inorganic anion transporter/carbonic anhydrase [Bacteroidales bacterium]|nr:bifunctional SulP family inorganic anion transporter/carbonic anhydrase [Bacteroidales bacterium]MCF8391766.1 bifunctional SulP family inorganic anion transporter/carbonic anhydrase [Bacteroidales bacterium]
MKRQFFLKKKLYKIIPGLLWLREYRLNFFGKDVVSGLTLAAYAIPVSLAYATLAGLPPQYGVYGYLIGGVFYSMLGTGKQLAIGPTSAISMLLGLTLAHLSGGDIQRWIDLASLTALLTAGMSFLAYLLKLSSIVNFISEPVLLGFKAGAAITIGLTQIPKLFGVAGGGEGFIHSISILFTQLPNTNFYVLIFGIIAIALLIIGEKIFPGKPIAIIVVTISVLVISYTPLGSLNFKLVGIIPSGLPNLHFPPININDVEALLPLSFACFLLAYIESVSAAKTLAQAKGYEIDAQQELFAISITNLAVALGHGYPVSGGLSQSAVNDKAGAKTPVSLVIASLFIALCLLFLTGLLKNLPYVILASIVLVAIAGLVDLKEMKRLYKVNKSDLVIAMIALICVIVFGILHGVLIAALFSLILIIRKVSSPHIAFLGRIPGTDRFTDIQRHPDNELIPGVLLFRVESALVYFNISFVYNTIWKKAMQSGETLKIVIFDLSTSATIDSSGARLIKRLHNNFEALGIEFKVAEAHSTVRDILRLENIENLLGHVSRSDSLIDILEKAIGQKEGDIKKAAFKPKKLLTPDIVSQIILGNNYFTKTHPNEYFESFSVEQKPYITLVTCSDSRVPLNALLPDTSNKVFSIQNIGNQILSTEGSVDYGVYHLKTPLLLFLGHSDCGAIKSYLKGFDKENENIRHELDFLRPSIIDHGKITNFNYLHSHITEKNLDYQVNIAYKKYKDLVVSGELTIMAGFYDFSGDYGKGKGDIVIVNVNKNKDIEQMRNMPVFEQLSRTQKILHIGRLEAKS